MKLIVRQKADDDLDTIFAWIAKDDPGVATRVIDRIRDSGLSQAPKHGRIVPDKSPLTGELSTVNLN